MTNQIKIAIDPGKGGAMAVRYPDGKVVVTNFTTETEMRDELEQVLAYDDLAQISAILERVHAMPGQGVTSMFSFGANYGYWRGVLQGLRIPFTEVHPRTWQKGLMLGKVQGVERKRKLKQVASERYPDQKVTLKNADALLLLEVGV